MTQRTRFRWPGDSRLIAIAALACGGCVAPAMVMCVDPEVGQLLATAAPAAVQLVTDHAEIDDSTEPVAIRAETPLLVARPIDVADAPPPTERSVVVRQLRADSYAAMPNVLPSEPPRVALRQLTAQPAQQPSSELWTLQRIKPLQDISLDIAPPQLVNDQQMAMSPPQDYASEALPVLAAEQPFTRGDLVAAGYEWHPSPDGLTFCYQPLYFEEVNLERYGHSFGVFQPLVSVVAFYGRLPALPYMAFARPARRCTYHAHWTLPGYKLPQWEPQPIVPSARGAAVELAVLYGIILLIP